MGLTRKRLLAAATENTYGSSANPGGTSAILVNDDLAITPLDADTLERSTIQPHFGARRKFLVNQKVKITFSVDLSGSGTAGTAPKFGRLIKACGFGETIVNATSVTYGLLSNNATTDSVSLAFHADGQKHLALGCRGTVKLSGKESEYAKLMFDFTGIYAAPTDVSLPSPTYGNQADPDVVNDVNITAISINGWGDACLSEFELDVKNSIIYRARPGCGKQVRITDRAGDGKIMIEAPALSAHDFFADAVASSIGTFSFQHGQTAGNICTVSARCNFGAPDYGDSDGIQMLNIPVGLVPSSAGNDELSMVFT